MHRIISVCLYYKNQYIFELFTSFLSLYYFITPLVSPNSLHLTLCFIYICTKLKNQKLTLISCFILQFCTNLKSNIYTTGACFKFYSIFENCVEILRFYSPGFPILTFIKLTCFYSDSEDI